MDVSSVIDLVISDHYCIFFSALLPASSSITEQVVRKCFFLRPVFLSQYMLRNGKVLREHRIRFHNYADDAQLHLFITQWHQP